MESHNICGFSKTSLIVSSYNGIVIKYLRVTALETGGSVYLHS